MSEFLLVHGMSHGGWAWDALRARAPAPIDLDWAHAPMLSAPDALARILAAL